jgi:hypothetical protein
MLILEFSQSVVIPKRPLSSCAFTWGPVLSEARNGERAQE